MSENQMKTFNVDIKLHGYTTIQVEGKSKKDVEERLDCIESSMYFTFESPEFLIEDSSIDYFEIQDIKKVS